MKFIALTLTLLSTLGLAAQPADLASIAAKLPPLPTKDGAVVFPLGDTNAFRWRAIRDGVDVEQPGDTLRAKYKVVSGTPAGAAVLVRPGALADVKSLKLRVTANRNTHLIVSLQDHNGVAYAFPAIAARAGTRTAELSIEELSYLPQQSQGAADPGSYQLAETVMVTITDISGFMSSETPEVEWTIESLEGVR